MSPKNAKLLIVAIVVVVVALYAVYVIKTGNWLIGWQRDGSPSSQQQATESPVISQVDTSKLPDSFPTDIPLESGAKVEQNYNASVSGKIQATRIFVSAKSLSENFTLYKTWLTKNGWKIDATLDQPSLKVLVASKGSEMINITINANQQTKENTVNISYTTTTVK